MFLKLRKFYQGGIDEKFYDFIDYGDVGAKLERFGYYA